MTVEAYAANGMVQGLRAALDLAEVTMRRLDGTILHWSRGLEDSYGWTAKEAVGRVSQALLQTSFPAPLAEIEAELLDVGHWTGELVHIARDGHRVTVLSRWRLYRDDLTGETVVVEANTDITALRAGERALAASEARAVRAAARMESRVLVAREMSHRLKNALATVVAMADQTLRRSGDDPARFVRDFTERLRALGRAHDLLTAEDWQGGANLAMIIRTALAPWPPNAIELSPGPDAASPRVCPQQAQALVLALHELATNAAKYGALSRPEGRIAVRWSGDAGGMATLEWTETGGPSLSPSPPERCGFGSDLLRRALPRQLGAGATAAVAFEPSGVRALTAGMTSTGVAPPSLGGPWPLAWSARAGRRHMPHRRRQAGVVDGLVQEEQRAVAAAALAQFLRPAVRRRSGYHHDRQLRPLHAERTNEVFTGHVGHVQVGQQHVERATEPLCHPQGLGPVGGDGDVIAFGFEHVVQGERDQRLILGDEHPDGGWRRRAHVLLLPSQACHVRSARKGIQS
jgi:PAS domain S-box-containing protein